MTAVFGRVLRIRELDARQRCPDPPVPKSAKVELVADCNLRCRFCAFTLRPREHAAMAIGTFARIVRELRNSGVEQLGLFYIDEPFLCDWLPEAIRIAKDDCGFPYVFITSNGLQTTPQRVRACLASGLDSLKFAVNFSSPSQFAAATGKPAQAYGTIIHNIIDARTVRDEVAQQMGHYCRLSASSLEFDPAQRARMSATLAEIGPHVDEHYWLPVFGRPSLAPSASGSERASPIGGLLRKPVPCWSLFTEAHIAADGQLSACCLDHSPRFAMGDLAHMGFEQAWHGKPFRELRQAHLGGDVSDTACAQCVGYD